MARKILTYQLRVDEETGEQYKGFFKEEEDTLENWYKILNCTTIQIIHLTDTIDCILDDEGKLFSKPFNRLWIENGKFLDIFVGNIVCCRHIDAELSSILESDKEIIEEHLKPVFNFFGNLLVIPESELSDYESRC